MQARHTRAIMGILTTSPSISASMALSCCRWTWSLGVCQCSTLKKVNNNITYIKDSEYDLSCKTADFFEGNLTTLWSTHLSIFLEPGLQRHCIGHWNLMIASRQGRAHSITWMQLTLKHCSVSFQQLHRMEHVLTSNAALTKLSKTCVCFKLLLQGNPFSKLNNKNAKHFGVAPPVHEESQKWGQKHILDGLAGAFWGVAKLIEKYIILHQTEMSLSIVRSPGIFFSCFSYGVQSIFWGGPFVSSFSFFFTFWIHGCKAMASGQRELSRIESVWQAQIGWDTNHKWSHKKSYDSNDPEWATLIFFQNFVLKSM